MKSVCMVQDNLFPRLLEGLEQSGKAIGEDVYALNCSSPYIIRLIAEFSTLEHDGISLQDMSNVLELLSAVMYLGVHGHVFCSALQFTTCYEVFLWS